MSNEIYMSRLGGNNCRPDTINALHGSMFYTSESNMMKWISEKYNCSMNMSTLEESITLVGPMCFAVWLLNIKKHAFYFPVNHFRAPKPCETIIQETLFQNKHDLYTLFLRESRGAFCHNQGHAHALVIHGQDRGIYKVDNNSHVATQLQTAPSLTNRESVAIVRENCSIMSDLQLLIAKLKTYKDLDNDCVETLLLYISTTCSLPPRDVVISELKKIMPNWEPFILITDAIYKESKLLKTHTMNIAELILEIL